MARKVKPKLVKTGYIVEEFNLVSSGHGNLLDEKLTAIPAIKHFCCECQGGHYFDWRMADGTIQKRTTPYEAAEACADHHCYLYPYRMGKRPT